MLVSKSKTIHNVVIIPRNMLEIAEALNHEFQHDTRVVRDKYKRMNIYIKYVLRSEDGTQYEDSNLDIFSEKGILYTRKIQSVEFRYRNRNDDKTISVGLKHSNKWDYINRVEISGNNEDWVNGVLARLEEIINHFQKQNLITNKYFWGFALLLNAIFAIFVYGLVSLIIKKDFFGFLFNNPNISQDVKTAGITGSAFLFIILFPLSVLIISKIDDMFPYIELMVGPEHLQREKQKRKKLYLILVELIIPGILGAIFWIIR